jgi:hypothetical protein
LSAEDFFSALGAGFLFVSVARLPVLYGVMGSVCSCSWVKFYVALRDV